MRERREIEQTARRNEPPKQLHSVRERKRAQRESSKQNTHKGNTYELTRTCRNWHTHTHTYIHTLAYHLTERAKHKKSESKFRETFLLAIFLFSVSISIPFLVFHLFTTPATKRKRILILDKINFAFLFSFFWQLQKKRKIVEKIVWGVETATATLLPTECENKTCSAHRNGKNKNYF